MDNRASMEERDAETIEENCCQELVENIEEKKVIRFPLLLSL